MNHYSLFLTVLWCGLFPWCITQATPQFSDTDYTDYLPRYRTLSENFRLAQIDYNDRNMVLHLHFVSDKDGHKITFYGGQQNDAWRLTTSNGSRSSEAYAITRMGNVQNIRHNKQIKVEQLSPISRKVFTVNKGDLITCEVHFKRLPKTVRIAHLVGGDGNGAGNYQINCRDIQIKSKESPQLGNMAQMEAGLERFYQMREAQNFPSDALDERLANQAEEGIKKPAGIPLDKPLEHSLKPIDYMPRLVAEMEDLVCNERVILSNVYFQDNKAEFSGRVKAMQTINAITAYLNNYPSAKIVLHGHTDIFGNAFKNLELSKKRVWAVKSVLISKGIDEHRIITVHHGGAQPLIKYRNGGEQNRRVEAEILCTDSKEKSKKEEIE